MPNFSPPDKIISRSQLRDMIPVSDMTIWRWERDNKFPKRIRLAPNKVGWRLSTVMNWIDERSSNS